MISMNTETILFFILLAVAGLLSVASILLLNFVLVVFSSIMILLAVITYKLWYVFDALMFKHTSLVEIFDGYELSRDRSTAIRRIGERVSSSAVAALGVGKEVGVLEKHAIENVVAHVSYPFKFVMQVERLNIEKMTDVLHTRRSMKEIELSRLDTGSGKHVLRANQLKRELEQLEQDIKAISSGETPVRLVYYIMTSAVSDTFYDAEERAKSQIRELGSQFDALLKSKSKVLSGDDLLQALKMDSEMVLR